MVWKTTVRKEEDDFKKREALKKSNIIKLTQKTKLEVEEEEQETLNLFY